MYVYVSTSKLSSTEAKRIFEVHAVMYGVLKIYIKPFKIVINVKLKKLCRILLKFCTKLYTNFVCFTLHNDVISIITGYLIEFLLKALSYNFELLCSHIIFSLFLANTASLSKPTTGHIWKASYGVY
jgi:hypothetical protein